MCTDGTEICENTGPEKAKTNKIVQISGVEAGFEKNERQNSDNLERPQCEDIKRKQHFEDKYRRSERVLLAGFGRTEKTE